MAEASVATSTTVSMAVRMAAPRWVFDLPRTRVGRTQSRVTRPLMA